MPSSTMYYDPYFNLQRRLHAILVSAQHHITGRRGVPLYQWLYLRAVGALCSLAAGGAGVWHKGCTVFAVLVTTSQKPGPPAGCH